MRVAPKTAMSRVLPKDVAPNTMPTGSSSRPVVALEYPATYWRYCGMSSDSVPQ